MRMKKSYIICVLVMVVACMVDYHVQSVSGDVSQYGMSGVKVGNLAPETEETLVSEELSTTEEMTMPEETSVSEELSTTEETSVSEETSILVEEPTTSVVEPTMPKPTTTKNTFEVRFDYNGGVDVKRISKINVTNGKKYGSLPETKRRGYEFKGWYASEGGGKKITKDTVVKLKDNQNLYARWKKISVSRNIKISKFNQRKGKITIKVSNAKNASGYIIYCSDNKKFKMAKKIDISPSKKKHTYKVSDVIKKAKPGRVYYYRIRPYIIDSAGKKVWGSYGRTNKCLYRK